MRPWADLWFVVDGGRLGKQEYALVNEACLAVTEAVWVFAATGGTQVCLDKGWERDAQLIADRLAAAGHDVAVGAPPGAARSVQFREAVTLPFVTMVHRLEPPMSTESMAHPYVPRRWNPPAVVKRRLFERAAEWVVPAGEYGAAGQLGMVSGMRQDLPDILEWHLADHGPHRFAYLNGYQPDGWLDREVVFAAWGTSSWAGLFPGASQLERVESLREVLVGFAEEIEVGWINIQPANSYGGWPQRGGAWSGCPQLWDSYLPDAFGGPVGVGGASCPGSGAVRLAG